MYKIASRPHIDNFFGRKDLAPSFLLVIEEEVLPLFPTETTDTDDDLAPQFTVLIIASENEFLPLVSTYPKPEYVEKFPTNDKEVCKICYMLDNECMVFVFVEMSETVAEWIDEEVE